MHFNFLKNCSKVDVLQTVKAELEKLNFEIVQFDFHRPWGGFFVIDESQTAKFVNKFFPTVSLPAIKITEKLSPKILVVAPEKRLSWQFHNRRAELWRIVEGPVGIKVSQNDDEGILKIYNPGNSIELMQGERHRLIGLDSWGVVAEIWQHTKTNEPSDEEDIIRLQDDFGR